MSFLQGYTNNDEFEYGASSSSSRSLNHRTNNNLTEFETLERDYKNRRFYIGTEHIKIFKPAHTGSRFGSATIYFCDICQIDLDRSKKVFPHLASYEHIFRHTKSAYPNEYSVITAWTSSINNKIKAVISMNQLVKKRALDIDTSPREFECNDVQRDVNNYLYKLQNDYPLDKLADKYELVRMNWAEDDKIELNPRTSTSTQHTNRHQPSKQTSFFSAFTQNSDEEMDQQQHHGRSRDEPPRSSHDSIFTSLKSESDRVQNQTSQSADLEDGEMEEEVMKNEPFVVVPDGYETDDLLKEKDVKKLNVRVREKAMHCVNNKLGFSLEFERVLRLHFMTVGFPATLTPTEKDAIYEILYPDESSDSDED